VQKIQAIQNASKNSIAKVKSRIPNLSESFDSRDKVHNRTNQRSLILKQSLLEICTMTPQPLRPQRLADDGRLFGARDGDRRLAKGPANKVKIIDDGQNLKESMIKVHD